MDFVTDTVGWLLVNEAPARQTTPIGAKNKTIALLMGCALHEIPRNCESQLEVRYSSKPQGTLSVITESFDKFAADTVRDADLVTSSPYYDANIDIVVLTRCPK